MFPNEAKGLFNRLCFPPPQPNELHTDVKIPPHYPPTQSLIIPRIHYRTCVNKHPCPFQAEPSPAPSLEEEHHPSCHQHRELEPHPIPLVLLALAYRPLGVEAVFDTGVCLDESYAALEHMCAPKSQISRDNNDNTHQLSPSNTSPRHTRSPRIHPPRSIHPRRRRPLHGNTDDVLSPQNNQSQTSLLLSLFHSGRSPRTSIALGIAAAQRAKLLGVDEDEVEMFVKGEEGADDGASVGEGDAEAVFDVSEEFGSFAGWLWGGWR